MPEPATLLERFRHGDRLALSRLLSMVARGENVALISAAFPPVGQTFLSAETHGRQECLPHENAAPLPKIVAITGSAGVGKSTLIGKLIEQVRSQKQTVAVLACDPQSPLTGGALLGDRFRMPGCSADDGVFIRSLAALSGRGAVAEHVPLLARLLGAFGFDMVLIETVGAGQGDVTVAELADVVVLLLQPETGDDLQWEKAGVLEVADLIVVQKADLPRAEHVAAQVRAALHFSDKPPIPVLLVSAKTDQGITELWQKIGETAPRQHQQPDAAAQLLRLAQQEFAKRYDKLRTNNDAEIQQLIERWQRAEISNEQAVGIVLKVVANGPAP